MTLALDQAHAAAACGEVPVGAVVVRTQDGALITAAHNRVETDHDPTAHAELLALRAACALLKTTHLEDYTLIVTLEPCAMCAQALAWARIGCVVFGAYDPKSGGVDHGARVFDHATCHHKPQVIGGVLESACVEVLRGFFSDLRRPVGP